MDPLQGQIAVVTGSSSGIGKAIALNLAKEGALVCLVGRDRIKLEAIRRENKGLRSRMIGYKVDLEKHKDIQSLPVRLQHRFKKIDILIHCAGLIFLGGISKTKLADYDRQFKVNVRAPFFLTQLLLPMIISSKGQVVFINSSSGLNAKKNDAAYSASKHALKAVADSLRNEVNIEGVRVLSVYPGRTATPMQKEIFTAEGRIYKPELLLQPEDIARLVIDALRLSRTAEITDIIVRSATKWD